MNRQEQINYLKSLSLEEKVNQKEKSLSWIIAIILVVVAFVLAIYDSFVDSIIFHDIIDIPILKMIILVGGAVLVAYPIHYFYTLYWKEYNDIIEQAKKEYAPIKKSIELVNNTRLDKEYIETHMNELSDAQFRWHSTHYCWACGEEHVEKPVSYTYTYQRTETKKSRSALFWVTRTQRQSAQIPLCPKCYDTFRIADQINKKNTQIVDYIFWGLRVVVCASVFFYMLIDETYSPNPKIWMPFASLVLVIGIVFSLGSYILYPLAMLIASPFVKWKETTSNTRWDFRNIPTIRQFIRKNLWTDEQI